MATVTAATMATGIAPIPGRTIFLNLRDDDGRRASAGGRHLFDVEPGGELAVGAQHDQHRPLPPEHPIGCRSQRRHL